MYLQCFSLSWIKTFVTVLLIYFFFPPLLLGQLRVTVWSLCTKAVSYIKYPKACQKGEYENGIMGIYRMYSQST